jgi:hypothetical protein
MASLEALDEVMVPGATLPEPATAPEAAMLGMVGRGALGVAAAAALAGCPQLVNPPVIETVGDPYEGGPPVVLAPNLKRLVDRITFGANARETNLAASLGYDGYLEYHLNPQGIDDEDIDRQVDARFPGVFYTTKQVIDRYYMGDYQSYQDLVNATIFRAVYSRRQLFERTVEFWSDHFSTYLDKDSVTPHKIMDDREVVRRHAFGNFPALLSASAHSPAMLAYLDNDPSVAEDPNQNYARELMELHTIGVGNYTQFDVEEVARCFTGWSFEGDNEKSTFGTFKFNPYDHDANAKTVLGFQIPAGGGVGDGERVLQILSQDASFAPLTAARLARKLAVKFWGDAPPAELVEEIATAYLETGGDIKAMLRVVLSEAWLSQAPPKFKRPFHLIASALRSRPSQIEDFWSLRNRLEQMNHHPFYWLPPNGYPEVGPFWMSFLVPRWKFAVDYVGWGLGATVDWTVFDEAADDTTFMDNVNLYVGGGAYPFDQLQAIYSLLRDQPNNYWRRRQALGLAFATPAFQWV